MTDRHPLVGYFTEAAQAEPAYDPPHNGPCLVCWQPLTPDDVRTISVCPLHGADASLFFRVHRTCAEYDPDTTQAIEHAVIGGEFKRLEARRD